MVRSVMAGLLVLCATGSMVWGVAMINESVALIVGGLLGLWVAKAMVSP